MKPNHRCRIITFLCCAALCLMVPAEARANAIGAMLFPGLIASIFSLIFITVFVVFAEGKVLSVGLKIPYGKTLPILLWANVASLFAGVFVALLNEWLYSLIQPVQLGPYFKALPLAIAVGTANFFVATWIIEFLIINAWRRSKKLAVSLRRVAVVVLVANAFTYAVLTPLHYMISRPTHSMQAFTEDSQWAAAPPVRIFYTNLEGQLCSILTNGQDKRIVIADKAKDCRYMPDTGVVFYRKGENTLCVLREAEKKPPFCVRIEAYFDVNKVAVSPDTKTAACLIRTKAKKAYPRIEPYELIIFDVASGRSRKTGIILEHDFEADSFTEPRLAWSESPSILTLFNGDRVEIVTIHQDLSVTSRKAGQNVPASSPVYGHVDYTFSKDRIGAAEAEASDIYGYLKVKTENGEFGINDSVGAIFKLRRPFKDVCFVHGGRELIFDDKTDIYLMDMAQRKVGRIAHGTQFFIVSDRYMKQVGPNLGQEKYKLNLP